MPSLTPAAEVIHLGMDTSINAIVVGVLRPGEEMPAVERIFNDEASIRRLIGRFPDRGLLWACYGAGPGGYALHRLLSSMGVACDVVAPALIPKGSAKRVKTDRRDSVRLARPPRRGTDADPGAEAGGGGGAGSGARPRGDALDDRKRMAQRLNAMLLRHGRIWRGGAKKWTAAHRQWVAGQVFDEPPLNWALAAYLGGLQAREAELAALESDLAAWAAAEPLAGTVGRLGVYRGIALLTGLTLAAEVVDWRRFASGRALMGFAGLVPTEYSSGDRTRRGHITKAGPGGVRTALVEAVWAYQHRPAIGAALKRRQAGASRQTLARSCSHQGVGRRRQSARAGPKHTISSPTRSAGLASPCPRCDRFGFCVYSQPGRPCSPAAGVSRRTRRAVRCARRRRAHAHRRLGSP
jgi:transposase